MGLVGLLALGGTAAQAQSPRNLDVQNFRPAMDSKGFITVERSKALGTFEPSIGLFMNYSFNPLSQSIDGKERQLIDSYGSGNFVLALGFANIVEIGANVPVVIVRGDPDGPGDEEELSGDGLGDMTLSLKVRLLDRERYPVGIALVPQIALDTGQTDIFASQGQSVVLMPKVVFDFDLGERVGLAINIGARLRDKRTIDQQVTITDDQGVARVVARTDPYVVGKELTYSVGVGFAALPDRVELIVEAFGAAPLESGAERATPLETLAAVRLFLVGNSFFTLGASRGWMNSYGDPDLRVFAGIVFEPAIGDRDGDGVKDDIDKCPDAPEDKDGWDDLDGCPDLDNDNDGIEDLVDQCPDIAEDMNGFEDDDGCPEGQRDRDGDGILDLNDKCPDQPEDKDGYEDQDGCPDLDNDRDGIPDVSDQCPMVPEDIDGWEDEDGCPDPDNDGDGIPDSKDACPNEPENFNGIDDEDGCPEVPKKVIISGGKLEILDKIYFEYDSDVIKSESYDILFQVAQVLQANLQIEGIEVQGHTDSRGSDTYNMKLSRRRAASVRRFLVDRGRVEDHRLTSRGYGESQPLDPAENIQAWAKNRRVEFIITSEAEPAPFDSPVVP